MHFAGSGLSNYVLHMKLSHYAYVIFVGSTLIPTMIRVLHITFSAGSVINPYVIDGKRYPVYEEVIVDVTLISCDSIRCFAYHFKQVRSF